MTSPKANPVYVAIACGGTGGHLFPGLAIVEQLKQRQCDVALLISPKDIDQQGVKTASGVDIFTLPAIGLQNRNYLSFASSFLKSLFAARRIFRNRKPDIVLAMGGFTSAPPVLVGRYFGAKTFLHESNTIPGRANRFISKFVHGAFVGFPETANRLKVHNVTVTGTPVRPQFRCGGPDSVRSARAALGLEADRPTILIVGGSQGARGLNEMVLSALPLLAGRNWQWLHLSGAGDFEKVKSACAAHGIKALVKPFLAEMDLALRAATAAVSRAGSSSMSEIAAMKLPVLLVPLPTAADNHQYFNALAYEKTGAARLLEQKNSTPQKVAEILTELVENETVRSNMQTAISKWHAPGAAEQIAEILVNSVTCHSEGSSIKDGCCCGQAHDCAKSAMS